MSTLVDNITALLSPTVSGLGFELWGIEYIPNGKNSVLRIFIDSDNGIEIDDCAAVSRQVSGVLDVEDPIPGEYNLEVSSPGMDRLLFKIDHYRQFLGQAVKVKLNASMEGRKNFKGVLEAVTEDSITLGLEESSITIGLWQIGRGQLIPNFD